MHCEGGGRLSPYPLLVPLLCSQPVPTRALSPTRLCPTPEQAAQTAYALLCGDATPASLQTLAALCARAPKQILSSPSSSAGLGLALSLALPYT